MATLVPIIIEIGQCYVRAGFANEGAPRVVTSPVAEVFDNVLADGDALVRGVRVLLDDLFVRRLGCSAAKRHVTLVVTEPFPSKLRGEMVKVLLSEHSVNNVQVLDAHVCASLTTGSSTALVLDVSRRALRVTACVEGAIVAQSRQEWVRGEGAQEASAPADMSAMAQAVAEGLLAAPVDSRRALAQAIVAIGGGAHNEALSAALLSALLHVCESERRYHDLCAACRGAAVLRPRCAPLLRAWAGAAIMWRVPALAAQIRALGTAASRGAKD